MLSLRSIASLVAVTALVAGCGAHPGSLAASEAAAASAKAFGAAHAFKAGDRQLFVLPGGGDEVIVGQINAAKRNVKLEVYMLTEPTIVNALLAAHQRGVDVQVMLEPHPFNPANPNMPLPTNHKAFNALQDGGVNVKDSSPAFTFTHAKFMSVDDTTTVVSTANFTKTGMNGNREYLVVDQNPQDVGEFVRVFQADSARQTYTPSVADTVISPSTSRSHIMNLIASAKHTVLLADEVASDPALDALIQQKCKAGVQFKALLGAEKSSANDPVPTNVATAQRWTSYGAQVRFQSKPVLHAKTIVVDGAAMYVGSENFTTNSLDNNREIGLVLTDASLINPVVTATMGDWANAAPSSLADTLDFPFPSEI